MPEVPDYLRSPTCWSLLFASSFATALLTPAVMKLARRIGAVDGIASDVGGVDYWQYPDHNYERFGINYHIYSLNHNHMLRLKTHLPEVAPTIESVTGVWPGANWMEREIYDMFGVTFENHPDPRRVLMPFDWSGHPQRKDYPLGYEEVQFSFNYDRVQAKKPNPQE